MPSWTTPVDHVTGYVVTSTDWNNFFGANGDLAFLFGDSAWTAVSSFTNSWANSGGGLQNAAFILIGRVVYLRGNIKSGTIGNAAFTLPVGYRPANRQDFAVPSNALFGQLTVNGTGTVVPAIGSNVSFELSCSFSVV